MTTNTNPKSLTIIGAGLVGSLWAVLMRQRGYDVTIYEKRADPRQATRTEQRSINLVITSRGLHGLAQAGLLNAAVELSVPVRGRMIHNLKGEQTYQPYGQQNEYNLSISRLALNHFLIDAAEKAGAHVHFNHELAHIDFDQKKCRFQNGQSAPYELLFGADGAGSLVRKNLVRHAPERFQESLEWLPAEYIELDMPRPPAEIQFEQNALHIWPRGARMMMALANRDGSFTVTLYMPDAAQFQTAADTQHLFQAEFPDAPALMPQYVHEFLTHPRGRLGTVRTSHWTWGDSVALLGDAAHAILPFFGQGMNAGFEDCTFLLEQLDHCQHEGGRPTDPAPFWRDVFSAYDTQQRPNGYAIADMAYENWFEMSTKVADPQFLARKKLEALLEAEFPHLFKARYGMVTYTRIPYALVQKAGRLLDDIITELLTTIPGLPEALLATGVAATAPNAMPLARWRPHAEDLLTQRFRPFLTAHQIVLQS